MFWHHKHFGTKIRCSNFLCLNCTDVFAETKSFVNKKWIYICIILLDFFTTCDSRLSKILWNYCDIVSIPSFCTMTCNEALYSVYPGVPYELRNKKVMSRRGRNVATKERKVSEVEVELECLWSGRKLSLQTPRKRCQSRPQSSRWNRFSIFPVCMTVLLYEMSIFLSCNTIIVSPTPSLRERYSEW